MRRNEPGEEELGDECTRQGECSCKSLAVKRECSLPEVYMGLMWSKLRDVYVVCLCLCVEGRQVSRQGHDKRETNPRNQLKRRPSLSSACPRCAISDRPPYLSELWPPRF